LKALLLIFGFPGNGIAIIFGADLHETGNEQFEQEKIDPYDEITVTKITTPMRPRFITILKRIF
jgi:hypothetical protein